ncbi:dienelactone hydrolase family [Schizosaccharomyces osmophilus]|uniref:Dienelactone hydrolase family n=1 Tax=Schizosaccharomyces osmophilus TaxID=2545709 RepID=A0AAE9W770_9SCHI|nr:dienelactone hydrolase family [Schizosaccharomyces osmophilus]WBW71171.1 dienelactone hydrolase family [Schizosaccharomyces osmophilus]
MTSCCPTNLGPVAASGSYKFQGKEVDFGGANTYVVGCPSNKKVIVGVLDVYGLSEQIKIGADKLAQSGFTVYLPDFLDGSYLPTNAFSVNTPEIKKLRNDFISNRLPAHLHFSRLEKVLNTIKSIHGNDVQIGAYGLCWGAKLVVTYPNTSEFVGIACPHPSFPDPADANNVHVPVLFLASKDEDANVISAWEEEFKKNPAHKQSAFHTYHDMHHGFMATVADLSNDNNRKCFYEGYDKIGTFFQSLMK